MGNKETTEEAAVSWWQNKQVIQQKGLCRIYIPGSNYLNLQANEILFIFNNENKDWQQERSYSEEDMQECFFYAISQTGEGWNGEYPGSNYSDVEYEFKETWLEFIKNKNGTK